MENQGHGDLDGTARFMAVTSEIILKLESLGCMFATTKPEIVADPEKTLIEALDCFWTDKKIFTMLLGLLKFRISHLINTKRLLVLASGLDLQKQLVLSVVAKKIARTTGDKRFAKLSLELKKRNARLSPPGKYQDEFYINRKGLDKDFASVGARVANFFDEPVERKQKPLNRIFKEHPWFRLRAIAGPDYRADVIYLKLAGLSKNQIEAARFLGCHKSSISRVWASIGDIHALTFILGHSVFGDS